MRAWVQGSLASARRELEAEEGDGSGGCARSGRRTNLTRKSLHESKRSLAAVRAALDVDPGSA
jgi:hypothetical protein